MRTHSLNISYLVLGLVFLGIAGAWGLRASGVIESGDISWLVPVGLIVAGSVGLVAYAAKGMSRRTRKSAYPDDAGTLDTGDTDGTAGIDYTGYTDSTYDTEGDPR